MIQVTVGVTNTGELRHLALMNAAQIIHACETIDPVAAAQIVATQEDVPADNPYQAILAGYGVMAHHQTLFVASVKLVYDFVEMHVKQGAGLIHDQAERRVLVAALEAYVSWRNLLQVDIERQNGPGFGSATPEVRKDWAEHNEAFLEQGEDAMAAAYR